MRKIKSRGKRLDNGVWVEGSLLQDDYGVCMIVEFVDHHEQWHEVDPDTVGQYTGMKDKNGEEICEGDVLTDKFGSIGVVEWRNCGFVVNFGDVDIFLISDCFDDSYQMWAIGNMHDNPELLKGVE